MEAKFFFQLCSFSDELKLSELKEALLRSVNISSSSSSNDSGSDDDNCKFYTFYRM